MAKLKGLKRKTIEEDTVQIPQFYLRNLLFDMLSEHVELTESIGKLQIQIDVLEDAGNSILAKIKDIESIYYGYKPWNKPDPAQKGEPELDQELGWELAPPLEEVGQEAPPGAEVGVATAPQLGIANLAPQTQQGQQGMQNMYQTYQQQHNLPQITATEVHAVLGTNVHVGDVVVIPDGGFGTQYLVV